MLVLHRGEGERASKATLENWPCKAYTIQMVIRFGLVPGALDRDRCGCNHGGPTYSDPWQPRRDLDPGLSACNSERPALDYGALCKSRLRGRFSLVFSPGKAASPFFQAPVARLARRGLQLS